MRVLPTVFVLSVALSLTSAASAQTIVLDPGHGGTDPGAVGCMGLEESGVVLDVAQRTRALLEAEGLTVELTRDDDRAVGLSARASFANGLGADLFVSVHSNSNAGTPATGTETFISNSASATSEQLGGNLQREMVDAWGLRDRGLKRANFTVISSTRMPAALTELGFTNRCDPDAALLRDPEARADAADAHARAVLLTLGMTPPTGTTGVLRGVVFVDQGAGLEDTSMRIDTASVTVDGETHAVDGDTAHFLLNLPPGSYPVTASAPGFAPASRTCAVTNGGETWCSIGLRTGPPPLDAGPMNVDAGTADAGLPGAVDAAAMGDASVAADAAAPPPPGTDRPGDSGDCSCRTAGSPSGRAPWPLGLLLLGVLGLRRRRRAGLVALGAPPMLACVLVSVLGSAVVGSSVVGCAEPAAPVAAPVVASPQPEAAALPVHRVAPFAILDDVEPIGEGLVAPVLSADGRRVAMSRPDHSELWLYETDADGRGSLERLAAGPRVGIRPVFSTDALLYRHPEQSATAVPHHRIPLGGTTRPSTPSPASRWVHVDEAHRVVLVERGHAPRVISPEGDRYMLPALSPDGRHAVFWGLTSGVHLYRLQDGARASFDGGHPRFDPSGRWLVHDLTFDDGHELVGGSLYLVDLEDYRRAPIPTEGPLATQPALAAGRLAYVTAEGVVAGVLRFSQP